MEVTLLWSRFKTLVHMSIMRSLVGPGLPSRCGDWRPERILILDARPEVCCNLRCCVWRRPELGRSVEASAIVGRTRIFKGSRAT